VRSFSRNRALWLFLMLFCAQSIVTLGQTIAVRGSVHCCPAGKPAYERPMRNEYAIVVPLEYPQYAALVAQDGVFDLILPYSKSLVNKVLPIRFQTKTRSVGESAIFVSKEKILKKTDGWLYEIPEPIVLAQGCEGLATDLVSAQEELDQVWQEARKNGAPSRSIGPSALGDRVSAEEGPGEERIVFTGMVVDSTDKPLVDASVTLSAVHFHAATREDGWFRGVAKGRVLGEELTVIVSHPNHRTERIQRIISSPVEDLGKIVLTE